MPGRDPSPADHDRGSRDPRSPPQARG
ncbi:hypothetical protein R2601_03778 [Salipiger bermudensis HTCC2601]|uniref:Uncharacterized protein n=1 Tax=Salipiger bermudensis (strain DSM 26914 / JCM 13377 / KCTC 12554 / HTCC2601) TaxID=314265 RepID=Q0FW90_SALBH|nr:hypothetical protein R2601_03778 [Salipiger bermudensis HTCC2601]